MVTPGILGECSCARIQGQECPWKKRTQEMGDRGVARGWRGGAWTPCFFVSGIRGTTALGCQWLHDVCRPALSRSLICTVHG